ncbi:MAG: hypothetical protein AAFR38_00305 [Planctomycetota bacterium]
MQDKPPKKRSLLKTLSITLGVLVVLLVVLVALAPSLAGGFAKGAIESAAGDSIRGSVRVGSVSLSWFGSQKLGRVELLDENGGPVAVLDAELPTGLLALAAGGDLGVLKVTGSARVEQREDGSFNLLEAIASTDTSAPSEPAEGGTDLSFLETLSAGIDVESLELLVIVRDADGRPIELKSQAIDASARLEPGRPITAELEGLLESQGSRSPLAVSASLSNLLDANGAIDIAGAEVVASASIENLDAALLDRVLRADGAFIDAHPEGSTRVSIEAGGSLAGGLQIDAVAPGVTATAELTLDDRRDTVIGTSPATVTLDTRALGWALPAFAPEYAAQLRAQDLGEISRFPALTLTLEDLRAPLPAAGAPLDLRGAGATLRLHSTALAGSVNVPGARAPRALALDPAEITLEIDDLARGARLRGTVAPTLDGASAGSIALDLATGGLLDDAGAVATRLPSLEGGVTLTGLSSELLRPLLEPAGIDVERLIGRSADASIVASQPDPDEPARVTVDVRAGAITALGTLLASPQRVDLDADGFTATIRSLDAAALPALAGAGVTAISDARLTLSTLGADVEPLLEGDLRSLALAAELTVRSITGDAAGSPVELRDLRATAATQRGAPFRAQLDAQLPGRAGRPGSASASLNILKPFDDQGAPPSGIPASSSATIVLADIPGRLFTPVLQELGLDPDAVLGEHVTFQVQASTDADAVGTAVLAGSGDAFELAGRLTITPEQIRVEDQSLYLTHRRPEALLAASETPVPARLRDVTLRARTLSVPLNEGAPDLTAARLEAIATARGFAYTLDAPDGQPDASITARGPIELTASVLDGRVTASIPDGTRLSAINLVAPTADGSTRTLPTQDLELAASVETSLDVLLEGAPGKLEGSLTALGTTAGSRLGNIDGSFELDLAETRPAGPFGLALRVDGLNTSLVDALQLLDLELREAFGPAATARVELVGSLDQSREGLAAIDGASLTASIDSERLRIDRPARFTFNDGVLRSAQPVRLEWDASPAFVNALLGVDPSAGSDPSAPQAPIRMTETASATLRVDRLAIPLDGRLGEPDLRVSVRNPRLAMSLGAAGVRTFQNTELSIATTETPGAFRLTAAADENNRRLVEADLLATGALTGEPAITGTASLIDVPTPLVDALVGLDGLAVTILGPTASLRTELRDLPAAGGTIQIRGESSQSELVFDAAIEQQGERRFLVTQGQPLARVNRLQTGTGFKLLDFLPMFGGLAKDPATDDPATVTVQRLRYPLDGDVALIELAAAIDPGEVRYGLAGPFAGLLNAAGRGGGVGGRAGTRFEQVNLVMAQGVLSYSDLKLPIGEFVFDTTGRFDLVNRNERIELKIPAGAFAGEAIGGSRGPLRGTLNAAVKVPVVREGPMDQENKWEPNFESVLEDLFSPDNIGNIIDGIFRRPGGGG